jgi:hypothetical protein
VARPPHRRLRRPLLQLNQPGSTDDL